MILKNHFMDPENLNNYQIVNIPFVGKRLEQVVARQL